MGDGKRQTKCAGSASTHTKHDPGANEPLGIIWYQMIQTSTGMQWKRHIIDYSTRRVEVCRIPVVDIDGDGKSRHHRRRKPASSI